MKQRAAVSERRGSKDTPRILTVGHSTRAIDEFVALLKAHDVDALIDIRTVPRSRHNPQFNRESLSVSLPANGIRYEHAKELGGFRHATGSADNAGWHNAAFRGYADYMQTPEFDAALAHVTDRARTERLALMCAEAVPWRCHRSLVADALAVRGVPSAEIASPTRLQTHKLTPFAHVAGTKVTYPASD